MAATQGETLTEAPLDLWASLSLARRPTRYTIQNVSGGRRVFFVQGAPGTAPAPDAVAHSIAPGQTVTAGMNAGETLWAWSEGPAGATLAVTEAL